MQQLICGNINELYSRDFISCGNTCFNLFKTPVIFEHLFYILSVCFFHFKLVSIVNPKKLEDMTLQQ